MTCAACLESPPTLVCTCGVGACGACAILYGKPECMTCKAPFSKQFLKSPKLIKEVYRPYHETLLWERESALLANTQVLVEWQNATAELKKRLRFGERILFPPKPTTLLSTTGVFACPSSTCRGFISLGVCGVCRSTVCNACRELQSDDHMCSKETLDTLAAISQDSKPCPSCSAHIFRIEGCNHMFCTHCRTHWDWMSMRILTSSTNHYYTNTSRYNAIPTRCVDVGVDIHDIPQAVRHSHVCRYLYMDLDSARTTLETAYSDKVATQYTESLIQIRINFLNKVMTQQEASSKVYVAEQQLHKKSQCRDLLRLYMSSLLDLQHIWRSESYRDAKVLDLLQNLVAMCNEASDAIRVEYGGVVPKFNLSAVVPCVTLK